MKIQITHRDIVSMVSETIKRLGNRELLSEITAADAYTRFYQGKITPEAYQILMSGTTNMTPFHKIALDFMTDEKVTSNLGWRQEEFAKKVGNLWSKATPEARQYLIKSCTSDPDIAKSYGQFYYLLGCAAQMKLFSEKQHRNSGLEVLFENEHMRVTCTKNYSSSCHFYGKSHWCTASDIFGRYDGHQMFKEYTIECWEGKGILVQFYNGKLNSYQMQYIVDNDGNVREGQCCNWEDSSANKENINNMLAEYGLTYDEIFNNYIKPNAARLWKETDELTTDEDYYYNRKKTEKIKSVFRNIDACTVSKTADNFAKEAVRDARPQERYDSKDKLYSCWVTKNVTTKAYVVTLVYNGANETEKGLMSQYRCDDEGSFIDRYGRAPNNFMLYIIKQDGTIHKKWRGEISNELGQLIFITEGYDENLSDTKLLAIVNAATYEEIVLDPYNYIYIDDCEWFIDRNISKFTEAYNDELREVPVDEDEIDRGAWYICQPTREDFRQDRYLAINYDTLEKFYFVV